MDIYACQQVDHSGWSLTGALRVSDCVWQAGPACRQQWDGLCLLLLVLLEKHPDRAGTGTGESTEKGSTLWVCLAAGGDELMERVEIIGAWACKYLLAWSR